MQNHGGFFASYTLPTIVANIHGGHLSLIHTHTHICTEHLVSCFLFPFFFFNRSRFIKVKDFTAFYLKLKFQAGLTVRALGHLYLSCCLLLYMITIAGVKLLCVLFCSTKCFRHLSWSRVKIFS